MKRYVGIIMALGAIVSLGMFMPAQAQDPVRSSLDIKNRAESGSVTLDFMRLLTEQDQPGESVLEKLRNNRKSDFETLQELKTEVLVVNGQKIYDRVQEVLDGLKIPYDQVSLEEFPKKDLKPYVAVLINCYGEAVPGKANAWGPPKTVPADVKDKARQYVEGGGYLYTSDWTIVLNSTAFPEYLTPPVKQTGKQNETISVKPDQTNINHPFLKDVFQVKPQGGAAGGNTEMIKQQEKLRKANWMIEMQSLTYNIKGKVDVLLVSDELKQKYGSHLVGVTFKVDKTGGPVTGGDKGGKGGVVFHVIGHFYQQGLGNQDNDEVAKMYQMIANFIIEAKKAHKAIGKK